MSLLAGLLVDRYGTVACAYLFLSFCITGQALYGIAPLLSITPTNQYIMMFAGRFIFGLGGGAITIAQNVITAFWFSGKELTMAFGFTLTASRIGSVINFNLTPALYNAFLSTRHPEYLFDIPAVNGTATAQGSYCEPDAGKKNATHGNIWPRHMNATETVDLEKACRFALGEVFLLGAALIAVSLIFATLFMIWDRR
jgi:MFS family permease